MTQAAMDYLVRAREQRALADVIAFIEADPSHRNVRRLGPADAPHTLVVSMTEEQVSALLQHFGGQVTVEPDRPLSLYSRH